MPENFGPSSEAQSEDKAREIWHGSDIEAKIAKQRESGRVLPHVLITDRDGTHSMWDYTFKGTPEELADYQAATETLNQHVAKKGTLMIMNTGGSLGMMEGGLRDGTIPADGAIVAGGNEFYVVKDGKYVMHEGYQDYIKNVIGYKRTEVYPVCQELVHDLSGAPEGTKLEFQPRDSEENVRAWDRFEADPRPENKPDKIEIPQPFKISFHCSGGPEALAWVLQQLHDRLEQAGMGKFKVVHSVDTYEKGRYNVDVLAIDKQAAADIVIKLLEEQYGPVLAAVAGDAENDIGVVLHSGQAGITVGNRQPALEAAVKKPSASRESKHFRIIAGPEGPRLIYSDPDPQRKVGASLQHAVHALELADRLIKNRKPSP